MIETEKTGILLVDDQPANLLAAESALSQMGLRLVRAHSGRQALQRLEEEEFALVFVDLRMPGMDGIQTLRHIRQQGKNPCVPVVIMAPADAEEQELLQAFEAGAADYIQQPFSPPLLRARTAAFLKLFRAASHSVQTEEELAEANRSLLESQRFVRALTEAAPQIIFVYDLDENREIYVNSAVTSVLGYRPRQLEEMGSRLLERITHPDDLHLAYGHMDRMKRARVGEFHEYEARFRCMDGSWRWLCTRSSVFSRHPDGRPRQVAGISHDITDRKKAEAEMRRLNAELEHRVAERTAALEASEQRARLLSEASALLTSSLDYADTLAQVARLAVPAFADWCIVHALGSDGTVKEVAVAHRDPQSESRARQIIQRYPFSPDASAGVAEVIRSGKPLLLTEVPQELLRQIARDAHHLELIQALNLQSAISVPLVGRERVLGALSFATSEPDAPYDFHDMEFAMELARRAAMAIDNALLYRAAQEEIAERARAEQELRNSEARLSALFSQSIAGIAQTDLSGRFVLVNQRFCDMLGCSREELLRHRIQDFSHPDDLPRSQELFHRMAEDGMGFVITKRYVRPDGEVVWVQNSASVVNGPDGHPRYAVAVVQDVTDRKRAEEELLSLNDQLAEARDEAINANRAKSTFLASMSHELRTPLNAIIGYAELVEEELQDLGIESLCRDLERIRLAGNHLVTVIGDILDLSKIEAGKMELVPEEFTISDVIHEAAEMVAPLVSRNGNQLEVDCTPDTGRVYADRTRFRQVLFNLLSNAAKFTQGGTVSVVCTRAAEKGNDWIELRVRDTGVGISPEELTQLFESFQQGSSPLTRHQGGTGLGLAISRYLCRMMGGDIRAESIPGHGSTFFVHLPCRQPQKVLESVP